MHTCVILNSFRIKLCYDMMFPPNWSHEGGEWNSLGYSFDREAALVECDLDANAKPCLVHDYPDPAAQCFSRNRF